MNGKTLSNLKLYRMASRNQDLGKLKHLSWYVYDIDQIDRHSCTIVVDDPKIQAEVEKSYRKMGKVMFGKSQDFKKICYFSVDLTTYEVSYEFDEQLTYSHDMMMTIMRKASRVKHELRRKKVAKQP